MKDKVNAVLDEYFLDPTEVDVIFMELSGRISSIIRLGDGDSSEEELKKILNEHEEALTLLESRASNVRVQFLVSQIQKYKNLIDLIGRAI
ncbi:MAG: hypothetical protein HN509_17060 [Halobacteriovoraceae bacterium]|jgi:hypothetical protein|nr:hypothetical protein [Halobacteriovoraceae bacterium]MBT5095536.1 hypothetical protein [Halobacteriovoraceae bacterium]